jgi:hypothetical protein
MLGVCRVAADEDGDYYFRFGPAACYVRVDDQDLALARDWLTYWLLDMGTLGPRNFETWAAAWVRPDFLRMPDTVFR